MARWLEPRSNRLCRDIVDYGGDNPFFHHATSVANGHKVRMIMVATPTCHVGFQRFDAMNGALFGQGIQRTID
jgi:hypothetical protein